MLAVFLHLNIFMIYVYNFTNFSFEFYKDFSADIKDVSTLLNKKNFWKLKHLVA